MSDPAYVELEADSDSAAPIEIESLCPSCEETGLTKILCVRIPFYREVILISFHCPHCGLSNNELQSGAPAQEHGLHCTLQVQSPQDLSRQIVKSEWASIKIPEVELEIPHKSQPGDVTTVEGTIRRVMSGLSQDQERRARDNPDDALRLAAFIQRLSGLLDLEETFSLVLDDPSGNSHIASLDPTQPDPQLSLNRYPRSLDQKKMLGLAEPDAVEESAEDADTLEEDWQREVLTFQVDCYACGAPALNEMKLVDIPHFKQTVVMGAYCESCGYRSSEVKAGSGVSEQGQRLTLLVHSPEDLRRDVLKSETCRLSIPELDMEGGQGVMVGKFTTVEGLIEAVSSELRQGSAAHFLGDSADASTKSRMESFLDRLDSAARGDIKFSLVLDDPAGNSYIQSLDDTEADPRLHKLWYDRSTEQNEELGLNDINTDNYTQEDSA